MIGKVTRGSDTAGLLRYLFGPGRTNEHTDPHLIAAWDDDIHMLEPVMVNGRRDVRTLATLLDQPLAALAHRPATTVWQCSLRTAPDDRRLTDAEWADAAREVLDRTGLAPRGDDDACRWVAVRHADDHIHLAVTLARQDGRGARTSNDFHRVGEACRALEQRHNLTVTPPRDRTAPKRPTRGELEKARRSGLRETPRETLRREVRVAAAGATDVSAFLAELRAAGVMVKERHSEQEPGVVTGYAVAWPGDRSAQDDRLIWYGGSKLAPDLSLPRLTTRWGAGSRAAADRPARQVGPPSRLAAGDRTTERTPSPRQVWNDAARAAGLAATSLEALSRTDPSTAPDVAHATVDLLFATARALEGLRGGPVTRAADTYQRAGDLRRRATPQPSPPATALRTSARLIAGLSALDRPSSDTAPTLLRNLSALARAVSTLHRTQGHLAHAAAAQDAAAALHRATPPPRTQPTPPDHRHAAPTKAAVPASRRRP